MMLQRPPAWARWLLESALPRDIRDDVSGDLEEVYHARVAASGLPPARLWYVGQTIVFALRFLGERVRDLALFMEVDRPVRSSNTRQSDALFAHLFASQHVRERRVFWIAGALLNVPVALLLFQNTLSNRETSLVDLGSPVVAEDHSVLLAAPSAQPVPATTRGDGAADHEWARRHAPATETGPNAVETAPGQPGALQAPVSGLPSTYASSPAGPPDRLYAPASSGALFPRRVHAASLAPADARSNPGQRLAQFNDSLSNARAAAAAAEDWTVENNAGERSGITPGTLHGQGRVLRVVITLGDSVADVFRPPPGRRGEWAARVQLWHEIQQQARRTEVSAIFNERVRLIRERKNSERSPGESGKSVSRSVIAL